LLALPRATCHKARPDHSPRLTELPRITTSGETAARITMATIRAFLGR
jgi:hypothetical protein